MTRAYMVMVSVESLKLLEGDGSYIFYPVGSEDDEEDEDEYDSECLENLENERITLFERISLLADYMLYLLYLVKRKCAF